MRGRPPVAWRFYARAARIWAVAGGIIFLPCAILLLIGFSTGGSLVGPGLAALSIALTYVGAYLFYTGGAMMLSGQRGWRTRLILAPLATWNVLVVLTGFRVYSLARSIEASTVLPVLSAFVAICAVLHVFVNAAFLIGLPFVRRPAADGTESGGLMRGC